MDFRNKSNQCEEEPVSKKPRYASPPAYPSISAIDRQEKEFAIENRLGIQPDPEQERLSEMYENITEKLERCEDALQMIWETEAELVLCEESNCSEHLAELETKLLTMAAADGFVERVIYCSVIEHEKNTIIRYIEGGSQCKDFFRLHGRKVITSQLYPKNPDTCQENPHLYCVYNDADIIAANNHATLVSLNKSDGQPSSGTGKRKQKSRVAQNWKRTYTALQKLVSNIEGCVDNSCHVKACIILTQRINSQQNADKFAYCRGFTNAKATLTAFSDHLTSHIGNRPSFTPLCLDTFLNLPEPLNIEKQFQLVSCISNYFIGSRPKGVGRGLTSETSKIPNRAKFSYVPPKDTIIKGKLATRHLPNSHRNSLIHSMAVDDQDMMHASILHLLRSQFGQYENMTVPRTRRIKRQRQSTTVPEGEDIGRLLLDHNMADLIPQNSYEHFAEFMTSDHRILEWRYQSAAENVFVMNNIDIETGAIKPSQVVHVRRLEQDEKVSYECECELNSYIFALRSVSNDSNLDVQDVALPYTCPHCRYLRENFEYILPTFAAEEILETVMFENFQKAREQCGTPIQQVGTYSKRSNVIFSVNGHQDGPDLEFVHLTPQSMIQCQSQTCRANFRLKCGMSTLEELDKQEKLCPHLEQMYNNPSYARPFIQERQKMENADDEGLMGDVDQGPAKLFNIATQLWEIPAYSKHKPTEEKDVRLQECIRERLLLCADIGHLENGCLKAPPLIPLLPMTCSCGAGFDEKASTIGSEYMKEDFKTTVFTRNVAMSRVVMKIQCRGGDCWEFYSGTKDCLFFYTKETCVADEIPYDFVSRIISSKISFTAFTKWMSEYYESNNKEARKFISRSTFVSYFFAWVAAKKIDFRKDVDPFCKERKILAGDGTHCGVTLSRLRMTPIEEPTEGATVKEAGHKHYDRVYMYTPNNASAANKKSCSQARSYLYNICKKRLSVKPEIRDAEEDIAEHVQILYYCPQYQASYQLLQSFLAGETGPVEKSLAVLFHILSSDAPVSALLPCRFHEELLAILDNGVCMDDIYRIRKKIAPEIACVLSVSRSTDLNQSVADFIRYLILFVRALHEHDPDYEPAEIQQGTYDPETGVAYYVTEHGCRVRDTPCYELDKTRHKRNVYDDPPDQEECDKLRAKVSMGGFNYTFFWFCPIHGHCLGYHLMPGCEGRKDPFSSLYAYLPEPPEEIIYDFACSLSEYSLNREPRFFCCTRFWHDLFHGFAHKCAPTFNSERIEDLDAVNTEICEQFNAYLLNIRYTGSHMTQSHFCLFLQYMLYLWNNEKDARCMRIQRHMELYNTLDLSEPTI